jgi:mannose/cellobiose epimerase-like protein (N-acyl-D-glucosamine 2-epimerase family)
MIEMPVGPVTEINPGALADQYKKYLSLRIEFLLKRYRRFADFPGVQTGYDSITGAEFARTDILSYSWINGRGACVFSRFARVFPPYARDLAAYATAVIETLEKHWKLNDYSYPFLVNLDGTERIVIQAKPKGFKSYSDLYVCMGFLEYGASFADAARVQTAREVFSQTLTALRENRFVTEPDLTPPDRVLENPWSVALDVANEMAKQLKDDAWLDVGAELITWLLDRYFRPDIGAFVEYVTPAGARFKDEQGRETVDPGHAIEFFSFALEFSRLAERAGRHAAVRERVNALAPKTILWNIENGWNAAHPGIYKTIDAHSRQPINETMPWWILPEALLAVLLAYERTRDTVFLEQFRKIHNTYFSTYMNPITDFGPFQNIDGRTGKPVSIVPACKFQDPEFHSGKNLLTVAQVLPRVL